ncbi:MAG TPA: hypothetical protein VI564_00640, partial [Candidatus Nanoarchaeia archaeon]|nr:hypothetical protein [Candidatus Nanoarchaeia archaeon]
MRNKSPGRIAKMCILILLISISIAHAQSAEVKKDKVYLNLDLINLEDKNFILDINDLTSDLSEEKKITSGIKYGNNELYDEDNDGIEAEDGIIDFELGNVGFNWDADQSKLCTRWEIYSIDSKSIDSVCYGSKKCCGFVGKESRREDWKEPFYLSYGMFGASYNNIVSEQLVYVDYGLSDGKPYSDVHYSKWKSVSAKFTGTEDKGSSSGISIEDAIRQLQKLREKNEDILQIRIEDGDGKPLLSLNESNATVILTLPQNNENPDKKENEVIVSFVNFDPQNADWNKSEGINVYASNDELENSLEDFGIESRKIITLHGVSDFVQGAYRGNVKLSVEGYFDTVLHCSDNTIGSCKKIEKCFDGQVDNCYERNGNELSVNIPHFSSVVIGFNTSVANLTISSPDNSSFLQNGENVYLDFAVNGTVSASYSLDNGAAINLGTSNSFSALLSGNLDYGTLSNGLHTIKLTLTDSSSNTREILHSFTVQDSKAPSITLNATNGSAVTNAQISLKIKSNEFAAVSYKLNGNSYTPSFDLGPDKEEAVSLVLLNWNNVILINATDLQNNNIIHVFSFDYALQSSCSDGIKNGNEDGIDCGGSCPVCISFSISTDKQIYNNGENVLLSVTSRANSVVNATITKASSVIYQRAFFPVFSGAPISETTVV